MTTMHAITIPAMQPAEHDDVDPNIVSATVEMEKRGKKHAFNNIQ